MRASSQASLEAAEQRWEPVLADSGERALEFGTELFAVVDVLDGSGALRRALTDPGRDGADKAKVVADLLGGKVSEPVVDLVSGMARSRWSAEVDLADAVSRLAIDSMLASASATDSLEQVEEEVFRVGRLLAANRDLRLALADSAIGMPRRQELLRTVFADKVSPATAQLLDRSLSSVRHASLTAALNEIGELAAHRRRRLVAIVTAASPLTTAQRDRLADILARSYGRKVQVNVAVEPDVLGGLKIQIGDDVMDGTTVARLDDARRRLAG